MSMWRPSWSRRSRNGGAEVNGPNTAVRMIPDMNAIKLFEAPLVIRSLWLIAGCGFSVEKSQSVLRMEFAEVSRSAVHPASRTARYAVHDTKPQRWRHFDFFHHQAIIEAKCNCIRMVKVPWVRKKAGFTLQMESLIMAWGRHIPFLPLASLVAHIAAVSLYELVGATTSTRPDLRRTQVETLVRAITVLPCGPAEAAAAARIRGQLQPQGRLIGPLDTLIAATALAHDLTVATANLGEFARVPGLRLVDWTASGP